jgi:hypothetical protein
METLVENHFTWQYIPEDNSEHHTRRHENLKSHELYPLYKDTDIVRVIKVVRIRWLGHLEWTTRLAKK